jgi:hypothetical protein
MSDRRQDNDNELIDELTEAPTPSQSGSSGGELAREIGQRDELQSAEGKNPSITRLHKSDKPREGDAPNLPNRQETNDE